jgi:hypothetical protein
VRVIDSCWALRAELALQTAVLIAALEKAPLKRHPSLARRGFPAWGELDLKRLWRTETSGTERPGEREWHFPLALALAAAALLQGLPRDPRLGLSFWLGGAQGEGVLLWWILVPFCT